MRVFVPLIAIAAFFAGVGSATAAPGAYKILIVFNSDGPPLQLQQQIASQPGVVAVDLLEAGNSQPVPSVSQLASYDLVVDTPDDDYSDAAAYGNALADYLDAGGVLVQFAYDNWLRGPDEGNGPAGRFLAQGYPPYLPGDNVNDLVSLGTFDATNPLMQGVSSLETGDNTDVTLAPGATSIAKWSDGREAVAYKGSVVSSSAYLGGEEFNGSGDFGRLVVNAVHWLGRQTLSVSNLNPTGGTVTGGGLLCGPSCSAIFIRNAPVSVTAVPNPGFAFAGFGGSCIGTSCNLTMDAPKSVSANFYSFGTSKKVKKNKKQGTALLSFGVGGSGKAVLTGKKVKKRSKAAKQAGRVKLPIVAKGAALKTLQASGQAKVKVQVAFTPTGGSTATFTKKVTLRLRVSG